MTKDFIEGAATRYVYFFPQKILLRESESLVAVIVYLDNSPSITLWVKRIEIVLYRAMGVKSTDNSSFGTCVHAFLVYCLT